MRSTAGYLVLILVTAKVVLADENLFSSDTFLDDLEPISDLSFAFTDPSGPKADGLFRNENAPDLSSGLLFAFADPDDSTNSIGFDYFHPDEVSEYWNEGLTSLSADADNSNCASSESQLPARLRARAGTCAAWPSIDTPVEIDLLDPKLKLQPICPTVEFPFYPIAVCSSGNFLDEWGPVNNVILYNSNQVENPADLLACVIPKKLYCCRKYIPVTDPILQASDDTRHGRPWGRGLGAFCAEVRTP